MAIRRDKQAVTTYLINDPFLKKHFYVNQLANTSSLQLVRKWTQGSWVASGGPGGPAPLPTSREPHDGAFPDLTNTHPCSSRGVTAVTSSEKVLGRGGGLKGQHSAWDAERSSTCAILLTTGKLHIQVSFLKSIFYYLKAHSLVVEVLRTPRFHCWGPECSIPGCGNNICQDSRNSQKKSKAPWWTWKRSRTQTKAEEEVPSPS